MKTIDMIMRQVACVCTNYAQAESAEATGNDQVIYRQSRDKLEAVIKSAIRQADKADEATVLLRRIYRYYRLPPEADEAIAGFFRDHGETT